MIEMKLKLLTVGIVLLFLLTIYTGTISARLLRDNKRDSSLSSSSIPRIRGIILRSYIIGNATSGKQIGRIAYVKFERVEFKTIRIFPPGFGYVSYDNVSVIIFGLKSDIPDGPFHLDTKTEKNKVSSVIIK
jgi:hypothetical protein